MTHQVLAQAFNRKNGLPVGQSRWEEVSIKENPLFKNCKTILDLKNAYESFWNTLNPKSKEIVFVQQINIIIK